MICPIARGPIGLLGSKPSWDMMTECDTLLMVGSSFPYSEFLPKEGQARGVQIELDPKMVSIRYPMEVNLIGDSAETLRALIPLLERKEDRSWRQKIGKEVEDWWKVLEARAMNERQPDQSRSASSGSFRRVCRTTAFFLPIPVRRRTGSRAI